MRKNVLPILDVAMMLAINQIVSTLKASEIEINFLHIHYIDCNQGLLSTCQDKKVSKYFYM